MSRSVTCCPRTARGFGADGEPRNAIGLWSNRISSPYRAHAFISRSSIAGSAGGGVGESAQGTPNSIMNDSKLLGLAHTSALAGLSVLFVNVCTFPRGRNTAAPGPAMNVASFAEERDLALQDVEHLVLAQVRVRRRTAAGHDVGFEQHEIAIRMLRA